MPQHKADTSYSGTKVSTGSVPVCTLFLLVLKQSIALHTHNLPATLTFQNSICPAKVIERNRTAKNQSNSIGRTVVRLVK